MTFYQVNDYFVLRQEVVAGRLLASGTSGWKSSHSSNTTCSWLWIPTHNHTTRQAKYMNDSIICQAQLSYIRYNILRTISRNNLDELRQFESSDSGWVINYIMIDHYQTKYGSSFDNGLLDIFLGTTCWWSCSYSAINDACRTDQSDVVRLISQHRVTSGLYHTVEADIAASQTVAWLSQVDATQWLQRLSKCYSSPQLALL